MALAVPILEGIELYEAYLLTEAAAAAAEASAEVAAEAAAEAAAEDAAGSALADAANAGEAGGDVANAGEAISQAEESVAQILAADAADSVELAELEQALGEAEPWAQGNLLDQFAADHPALVALLQNASGPANALGQVASPYLASTAGGRALAAAMVSAGMAAGSGYWNSSGEDLRVYPYVPSVGQGEGPGYHGAGGSGGEVDRGVTDWFDPKSHLMGAGLRMAGRLTKEVVGRTLFGSGAGTIIDSELPDSVIFEVFKRNDPSLHATHLLFAHDSKHHDILWVRGTAKDAHEWYDNVLGGVDQELLKQQTNAVIEYVRRNPTVKHICGHSRGAAIAYDAAFATGRLSCGVDGAMVLARESGGLYGRNINKTGGFDKMIDPTGPLEMGPSGVETGWIQKLHHAELGTYVGEFKAAADRIGHSEIATGFEHGAAVRVGKRTTPVRSPTSPAPPAPPPSPVMDMEDGSDGI